MNAIPKRTWIIFSLLAAAAAVIWTYLTLPQLSFINLSIQRPQAMAIATEYLTKEMHVNPRELAKFQKAAIFLSMNSADEYLQKSLGYKKEIEFFKAHHFEIFFWSVRFYKENVKEEYHVSLSAADGKVVDYSHAIEDSARRPNQSEDQAWQKAVSFLQKQMSFDPQQYEIYSNHAQQFDHRTNYYFSWKKKDVFIPWSPKKDSGGAKLLVGATISGNEILNFYTNRLEIPNEYFRFMDRNRNVGRNLSLIFRIIFYIILTTAIFYVVVRRNDLVMHNVKKFAIWITIGIWGLLIADYLNEFQSVLYHYPTTIPLFSYLWQNFISNSMNDFIAVLAILMPCLAGESLHHEVFPKKAHQTGGFLHYLQSSFFSRSAAQTILLGYLAAFIMIGIQSLAFYFGQQYLGVWIQYSWMTQISASQWPLLGAFIVGATAGINEEICFRLFGINIGKKVFKNTVLACLIASVIWGYGHSSYPVYPMWFRGLEVTLMGLFLSYVYLKHGILATITAHYLFDVFWGCSAYLLNHLPAGLFYSSLAILLLPMALAGIAYALNHSTQERPLRWRLNKHQLFNLNILQQYLKDNPHLLKQPESKLKQEITSHGWDLAVVEIAINEATCIKDPSL